MINHRIQKSARHEFDQIHQSINILAGLVKMVDFPGDEGERADKAIADLETALLGPVARLRLLLGVEHDKS